MSSLPLGLNRIKIERSLTTSALAVFVPFVTQEVFMGGDAMYYGLNALSNNMILLDRKQSRCPNGLPFHLETGGLPGQIPVLQPVGPGDPAGAAPFRESGAEPGLGGMAHGLPAGMDGRILWASEPESVPRITEDTKNRALRLKTLGNAVCPPQAYPIFQYIAMIETGACANICPYGTGGDAP